jgi:hypothetical protein
MFYCYKARRLSESQPGYLNQKGWDRQTIRLRRLGLVARPRCAATQGDRRRRHAAWGGDIKKRGDVRRGENHRQPANHHAARPDDLPRADVEVHLRHPVVSNAHDDQSRSYQPARIDPTREE